MEIIDYIFEKVFSDECHSCFKCIDSCPVENTLYMSINKKSKQLSGKVYSLILIGIFLTSFIMANVVGLWQNNITQEEYKFYK